jgi:hypothetical protein
MDTDGEAVLPYRYRSRGRSALNQALFAVAAGMLFFAAASGAPVVVVLPMGLAAVGMGYLVLVNPRAGIDIDRDAVTLLQGSRRERIPLSEIARAHVEHWSDSTDVTLHRHDGGEVDIPDRCRPPLRHLTRALEAAGVTVTQS